MESFEAFKVRAAELAVATKTPDLSLGEVAELYRDNLRRAADVQHPKSLALPDEVFDLLPKVEQQRMLDAEARRLGRTARRAARQR